MLMAQGIAVSMDGRWKISFIERLWHSVKYEGIPLELMIGLAEYFVFYNGERPRRLLEKQREIA